KSRRKSTLRGARQPTSSMPAPRNCATLRKKGRGEMRKRRSPELRAAFAKALSDLREKLTEIVLENAGDEARLAYFRDDLLPALGDRLAATLARDIDAGLSREMETAARAMISQVCRLAATAATVG